MRYADWDGWINVDDEMPEEGEFVECLIYGSDVIYKEMGYKKIITYILETENGASLKASGWRCEAENVGGYLGCAEQTERS